MATTTIKRRAVVQNSILEKFFIEELKDIYGAEKQLQKSLIKLKDAAVSPRLKKAFEDHNQVTIEQISRLEDAFKILGRRPQNKKCEAMDGLIEEANGVIKDTEKDTATRDVALIMAAQKVEHYEIATYGGLAQLALTLGLNNISELLKETLGEEKETDELLSEIAKNNVNYKASIENKIE
jgi:ferritin-like metal-binding protein YciE